VAAPVHERGHGALFVGALFVYPIVRMNRRRYQAGGLTLIPFCVTPPSGADQHLSAGATLG